MGLKFSAYAIKASFLVENPDWYVLKCEKVIKKAAESGSTNYIYVWEGQKSPEARNSEELVGVSISKLINEKADWIAYPMFKAANGGEELTPDVEIEPESLVGVTLQGFVKRGARQDGTPMNDIVDWKPLSK